MSISTGKGDGGETGLVDGSRLPKDHFRIEAYGTVDELNATIGVVRSALVGSPLDAELEQISARLFDLGCDLATPGCGTDGGPPIRLADESIRQLDEWITREEKSLPPLRAFILPGGTEAAARLHLARTVCRRAERGVVHLSRTAGEGGAGVVYLNRLSDLLFLYARRVNHEAGVNDVEWRGRE